MCAGKRVSCPECQHSGVIMPCHWGRETREGPPGGHVGLLLTLCTGPPGVSHMSGQEGQGGSNAPCRECPRGPLLPAAHHPPAPGGSAGPGVGQRCLCSAPCCCLPAPPPLSPLLFPVMRGKQKGDDYEPRAKALFLFLSEE